MHWFNRPARLKHISKDIFQLFSGEFLALYAKLKGKRSDLPALALVDSELNKLVDDFFRNASTQKSQVDPSAPPQDELYESVKLAINESSVKTKYAVDALVATSSKITTHLSKLGFVANNVDVRLNHLTAIVETSVSANKILLDEVKSLTAQVAKLTTKLEAQERAFSESNIPQVDFIAGTAEFKSTAEALVTTKTEIVPAISNNDPDTQPLIV